MVEGQTQSLPECVHHWVLGPPKNRQSTGICRNCNTSKIFDDTGSDNRLKNDQMSAILERPLLKPRKDILSAEHIGAENE